jgi:hypothetical protein
MLPLPQNSSPPQTHATKLSALPIQATKPVSTRDGPHLAHATHTRGCIVHTLPSASDGVSCMSQANMDDMFSIVPRHLGRAAFLSDRLLRSTQTDSQRAAEGPWGHAVNASEDTRRAVRGTYGSTRDVRDSSHTELRSTLQDASRVECARLSTCPMWFVPVSPRGCAHSWLSSTMRVEVLLIVQRCSTQR